MKLSLWLASVWGLFCDVVKWSLLKVFIRFDHFKKWFIHLSDFFFYTCMYPFLLYLCTRYVVLVRYYWFSSCTKSADCHRWSTWTMNAPFITQLFVMTVNACLSRCIELMWYCHTHHPRLSPALRHWPSQAHITTMAGGWRVFTTQPGNFTGQASLNILTQFPWNWTLSYFIHSW